MKNLDLIRQNAGVQLTRRDFLWMTSMASAGVLMGCAANPVTGKSQLMLMSEEQEVNIDKKQSPHQISSDYGNVQDQALNAYIDRTGKNMAKLTHRPHMPYNFHSVNAVYINAYAFPGGVVDPDDDRAWRRTMKISGAPSAGRTRTTVDEGRAKGMLVNGSGLRVASLDVALEPL